MKLRTQILIFLLVFGLTPLLAAVTFNLPLVLDRVELLYHKAHLQNLRADFKDLDQHLASRNEMMRLLAKLPEPGSILGETGTTEQIDRARARYTEWINQILQEQLDIFQVLFLGPQGQARFWLERDPATLQWRPTTTLPDRPPKDLIRAARRLEPGAVLVSRIRLNEQAQDHDPRRLMTLYLISPIIGHPTDQATPQGYVVMSIDMGGMAQFYRNTLWVNHNGSYLRPGQPFSDRPDAFRDFPGLENIFVKGAIDLWKGPQGQQVIWIPMFRTEKSGPVWVGRPVDPSPIVAFRNQLSLRVFSLVFALIVAVIFTARWIAVRLESFGRVLTDGIARVLREDTSIEFGWRGPREVRELGRNLTALARTHAEHNRKLRQHARELEESNRYKSEFLANVSHELRTPLNSILLLSKMLTHTPSGLNPDQAKQAQVINEAASDLKDLIDNILDLSRIEAREVTVTLEWIELQPLIQELLDLVQPQFEAMGLYLRRQIDPQAPKRIYSDRDKLRQILKNFLANAVKFTKEGGVTVEIAGTADPGLPVRIAVTDTGIGIPEDKQEIVFEAFKQADGSTSRRYGGTGLGLSISRELARLLGGRIALASEEGRGSTFSLLLPSEFDQAGIDADRIAQVDTQSEPRRALPQPSAAPTFPDTCVLLAERDVPTLLHLKPLLEKRGLRVAAAGDREETLETLADDQACTLLMIDIMMPALGGCDTIKSIRQDPRFRTLRIVALAAPDTPGLGTRALAAGANDLLEKPVDSERLDLILARHLGDGDANG